MLKIDYNVFPGDDCYSRFFDKTDLYCVNCGQRTVWEEQDSEIDYAGSYLCMNCYRYFYMYGPYKSGDYGNHIDVIVEKLKKDK